MTADAKLLEALCAELFDEQTAPVLRRLGQRDRGAGAKAVLDTAAAETRAQLWAALAGAGTLRGVHRPADPATLSWQLSLAEHLGAALYQSPLLDTMFAADLLVNAGEADTALLDQIAAGERRIAVATRATGQCTPSEPAGFATEPGGDRISATRAFVAFAPDVDDLMVVAAVDQRVRCAQVPVAQSGVLIRRQDDVARGDLYTVVLDRAVATRMVEVEYPPVLARARLRHAGYLVGSATGALRLTTGYLRQRTAFGAPLAQRTALAYRLAALAAQIEAARAFADATVHTTDKLPVTAAQVLLLAARAAQQTAEEAVHLHGAAGLTERCDAQLFYRRAAVDAQWLGTPAALAAEAATRFGKGP